MCDMEKVIKGLTEALMIMEVHVPERYRGYSIEAIKDALALLKEQEPVEPKKRDIDYGNIKSWAWICGVCSADVIWGRRYCPDCGREVKWDG